MNFFGIIVLATLVLDYLLGIVADLLNLRRLRSEVPSPLQGVYDPNDYKRSQDYTRAATRFGFVSSTFTIALVLAFWFAGGFDFVDRVVRGWDMPLVLTGLAYIGILMAAYSLISLPFSIYHTFGIEQRFGFNRTTPAVFIVDLVKGLGLGVVLGGPLLAAVLFLFQYGGPLAWVYAWLAVVAFTIVVQYITPNWIMPLFNKFSPLPEGELRTAIMEYARSHNFPLSNLFVVDSSRRSTRANAYFMGIGRNKRIALFDTLIKQHTVPEIVGVLAHEIGHYKKRHVLQGLVLAIVHTGIIFFLLSLVLNSQGLYDAFYMSEQSVYTGLIFFGLLYTPVELVLSIAMNMVSRRNEKAADRYAVSTTNDPASLANALKKLSKNNLSNLTPHPFYVFVHYSHPPLLERVAAMEQDRRQPATPADFPGANSTFLY